MPILQTVRPPVRGVAPRLPEVRHGDYLAALEFLAHIMEPLSKLWKVGVTTNLPEPQTLVAKFGAVAGHLKAGVVCPACESTERLIDGLLPDEAHFMEVAGAYLASAHGKSSGSLTGLSAVMSTGEQSTSYLRLCGFLLRKKAMGKKA